MKLNPFLRDAGYERTVGWARNRDAFDLL